MKLLLQILWGWSVLANGAVGIQVGTVQTNNQNIKLMKMNFTSPVWLQSASNVGGGKECISFVDATGNPKIHQLSANGDVTIQSIYNGEPTTQIVSNPTDASIQIQSDANTEVILYGQVTKLNCDPGPGNFTDFSSINLTKAKSLTYLSCSSNQLTSLDVSANTALTLLSCSSNQLTSLDVSANTALTFLNCSSNQLTSLDVSANTALTNLDCYSNQLTSLDVSANTALTDLDCHSNQLTSLDISSNTALDNFECDNNPTLLTIDGVGVKSIVAAKIASAITNATSVDGTVTLRQGDEFNQTIIDAAMEKGWDVQYYQ
jgi:hypothetical protein